MYNIRDYAELEAIVNRELSLAPTNNSGAVSNDGDGKGRSRGGESYHLLLNDSKYTERPKKSYSISKADWANTKRLAFRHGRIPIMTIADTDNEIIVVLRLQDMKRIYAGFLERIAGSRGTLPPEDIHG